MATETVAKPRTSVRVGVQKFGTFLSGMIMPNIGAFIAWGIITATLGEPIYPWWLWVAGPPGAVLAVLYTAGIGRPRKHP